MQTFIIFLVCLYLMKFDFSFGVWRYHNILEDEKLYTTINTIFLAYDGPNFTAWEYPEECSLRNESHMHTEMICDTPGDQTVKPLVPSDKEEVTRHFLISHSYFSFAWYAAMPIDRTRPGHYLATVRVWIIDPEEAGYAEINNEAFEPSMQSLYLTKQFYNMGQHPTIVLSSSLTLNGKFSKHGYWTSTIPGNRQYVNFQILGQPVSFQDHFIISSWHTFYWPEPEVPVNNLEVSLRLALGAHSLLTWATCENYRVLLLSDLGTFITNDAFATYSEVKVNPGIVPVPPEGFFTIDEAALLDDGIIFRIEDALYWRGDVDHSLTQDPELPSSGVIGIHLRTSCVDYYPSKNVVLASLAVWQNHTLFIGASLFKDSNRQGPYLTTVMALPANLTIMKGVFGSLPTNVRALVGLRYPGGAVRPIIFSYDQMAPDQGWSASTLLSKTATEDLPTPPFDLLFLDSSQPALLLWNYKVIHYSFRNDMEWGVLHPPDLSKASDGSSIEQVIMDRQRWSFLIKMANNVLFYSKVGVYDLVRLHAWMEPDERIMLYDLGGQFYIVTLSPDAKIDIHRYPFLMETHSAMWGTTNDCPFVSFLHNMNSPSYYLDKGDSLEFWAQLVYPEGNGVHVRFPNNQQKLLDITKKFRLECVNNVDTTNMTFTISQIQDYSNTKDYADLITSTTGVETMELLPSQIGNTCTLPKNRISHFQVGCPSNRHIRVIRPWNTPCVKGTFNYTIPSFVLATASDIDLVVNYDSDVDGCVLEMQFDSLFIPNLNLYDGDKFVRDVKANFIVWEKFGRTDFSFSKTMREMGCLRLAQTWSSMTQGGKGIPDSWGPENYQSCFTLSPGHLGNLDQPYEILNDSANNFLTFSQTDSATYVFSVKVLDPNYSFCDLRATFSIKTFGISKPKYGHLLMYIVLVFIFIMSCLMVFSYWRYVHIFRKVAELRRQKYE